MNSYKHYKHSKLVEKWDIIMGIILIVLLIVAILFIFVPTKGNEVEVYKNGKLIGIYSLKENRAISVGGLRVEIFEENVKVVQSTCPDQLCVHSKPIMQSGSSIICVPNQVVIRITGKGEVEGVTG